MRVLGSASHREGRGRDREDKVRERARLEKANGYYEEDSGRTEKRERREGAKIVCLLGRGVL